MHGAVLALLILYLATLLGLSSALGVDRPVTMPIVLMIGLLLGRWFRRSMSVVAGLLLLAVMAGIWSPFVPRLARPFVRSDPVALERVNAVFVFSNGTSSRGLVNGEGIDRLLAGIALRARRPSLPLIVSIVRPDEKLTGVSSRADQQSLIALVPANGGIEWIDSVQSTRDEAVRLARRAFQARWSRVAVVTSPMHTRRACATVESLGLAVTCVAAPWREASWPATTSGDRMIVMRRLVYETLAWAQYRLTGWANWS